MLIKRLLYFMLLLICINCLNINSLAVSKDQNYKNINISDIKSCQFVVIKNNHSEKHELTLLEKSILVRLFNTSYFVDHYNQENSKKFYNPYIELQLKSGSVIKIYTLYFGFVILDNKTQCLGNQMKFISFYNYLFENYKNLQPGSNEENISNMPKVFNIIDFTSRLKKLNYMYRIHKTWETNDILSAPYITLRINGQEVVIYEYRDNLDMELDAMSISKDASSIGNLTCVDWVAAPHIYKKGNIIVCYFGDNIEIIKLMEQIMDKQFAGFNK